MSSPSDALILARAGAFKSNLTCFGAMFMWAFAFPIAEIMLATWDTVALVLVRQLLAVMALLAAWIWFDGWRQVRAAHWRRGIGVGGIGFGIGAILLLVGQALSDPVTPAIAAAMMPIVGAVLEVLLDQRRLRPRLLGGILLALAGGLLATGVRLEEGRFGLGSLLCLLAVILFAWATRSTTRNFESMSVLGQTTVTLAGSLFMVCVVYAVMLLARWPGTGIGLLDPAHVAMLVFTAVASMALAQFLWIRGATGLGILLASFHMNAVPFYVMLIMVVFLGASWNWWQAAGALLVGLGVLLAQSVTRERDSVRKPGAL